MIPRTTESPATVETTILLRFPSSGSYAMQHRSGRSHH